MEEITIKTAENLKEGDVFKAGFLSKMKYEIDGIDAEFINDDVSNLYDDDCKDEDIKPEHTKYSFWLIGLNSKKSHKLNNIKHDAKFVVLK